MDIVLGVSMAPASVQMVMLQGETAGGTTIDETEFPVTSADDSPTVSASDRVIAAIMCTREDAAGAGLELDAIGVAWTDQLEAAVLRDALAAHKIENVLLVSAFLAATALTQSVGGAMGYERTAVLFVEPDTATLAVVETSDGSIDDVHTEQLDTQSGQLVTAELVELVGGLDELPVPPGGLFVVGSGVDITPIRRSLEEATSLTVNVPEEPETALARGAALASANSLASSTAALAYAQDPGTGAVEMSALPDYLSITGAELGEDDLAYSAVADDEADAPTTVMDASDDSGPRTRPGLLVGSVVAVAGFSAALALEIALSLGIRTTVGSLPAPIQGIIAPVQQALLPAPEVAALKLVAPAPLSRPPSAPAPAAPVPAAPPVLLPAAPPVVVPAAPAVPAPAIPVPVFVPPIAPVPAPPVQLPNPPASPPVVEAPPHSSPPIYVPPPKSPPHRPPPGQSPPPNSGGGGPVGGPGPVRGNPGSGGPRGGGPADGPNPGHGTPGGGGPVSGGGPTGGGPGPVRGNPGGGGPHGGGPTTGGPTGGGPTTGGGGQTPSGGPTGSGGQTPSGGGPTGGGPTGAGGTPSGGGPTSGGESPSDGGPSSSGGQSPSGGGPTGGGESPSGGAPTSGGSPSESSGGGSPSSGGSESSGGSPSSSSSGGSESSGGSSSSSSGESSSSSSSSGGGESSSSSSSSSSGSESSSSGGSSSGSSSGGSHS